MSASLPGTWTGTDTPGEMRPGKINERENKLAMLFDANAISGLH